MPFNTAEWVREQCSSKLYQLDTLLYNTLTFCTDPGGIFTLLMIIGGDVVGTALAQLSAGKIPYLTPVVFSFGWVSYAIQAMISAVGENRLLPKPELDSTILNVESGYARTNYSWVLSRILRDFPHWRGKQPDRVEEQEVQRLKAEFSNDQAKARVGLRVTVWRWTEATGRPRGDKIYYAGLFVAIVQLVIAAVPWIKYGEWLIFMTVASGTALAFISGALPQWQEEKFGVRALKSESKNSKAKTKDVILKRTGTGDHDVLLILGSEGSLDLEALAAPYRELKSLMTTKAVSFLLAGLWAVLLLTIAGYEQNTWFLMAAGILGMLHNVVVAGFPR